MVARREWTIEWWDHHSQGYELVTSLFVIEELKRGGHPEKQKTLDLISGLSILPVEDYVYEMIDTYVKNFVMPRDTIGDAAHLAMASFHSSHFLLTWNCMHLANANKFEQIRHFNNILGVYSPTITTPLELLSWDKEIK